MTMSVLIELPDEVSEPGGDGCSARASNFALFAGAFAPGAWFDQPFYAVQFGHGIRSHGWPSPAEASLEHCKGSENQSENFRGTRSVADVARVAVD
jgi:hypothetical protein